LQKKTEFIKSNIKEINERNIKVEKATQEIDSMLENLSTASSQLDEVDQAL
jgi:methyl-accepting chemotaxis protein